MSPGKKDGEVRERQRCNAIPKDLVPIDCLTDTALRGVAVRHTDLGLGPAFVGLVERELICSSPCEYPERQHRAQESK